MTLLVSFVPCSISAEFVPLPLQSVDFFAGCQGLVFACAAAPPVALSAPCDDLSQPLPSCVTIPGAAMLFSNSSGLAAVSALPRMPWETEELSRDDDVPRGLLPFGSPARVECEEDLSGTSFVSAAPSRLLSRSLSLAWWTAVELEAEDAPLVAKEAEEFRTMREEATVRSEVERELMASPERPYALPCAPLPGTSLLVGSGASAPSVPLPSLPLPEALGGPRGDATVLPQDGECPGVALTLPLPSHLSTVAPPLLSCAAPALTEEPPRCSLVSLELQMSSATLALRPVHLPFSDRLRFAVPLLAGSESEFVEESVPPTPRAEPPSVVEVSFADHVNATDDDQFIASARAETQRLAGYHDNGRGDIHHFLAMCADFAAHRSLFEIPETFAQPKGPPPKAVQRLDVASQPLRPLSRRGGSSAALPPPVVVVADKPSDLLSSFMKARGVERKKTWSLQRFAASDDAASTALLALAERQATVRVNAADASKSLLPLCLLAAAKYAAQPGEAAAVCLHEDLAAATLFLARHADCFEGVRFDGRPRARTVAHLDENADLSALPPKCLVLVCGSAAFVRRFASVATVQLVTEAAESVSAFDIVLEPLPRVTYALAPLSVPQRQLIGALETGLCAHFGSLSALRCASPASVQGLLDTLPALPENTETMRSLVLLHVGKSVAHLLGSQSVASALSLLREALAHPTYGAWVATEFAELATELESRVAEPPVKREAVNDLLSRRRSDCATLVLASAAVAESRDKSVTVATARACMEDSFFPWSSFQQVLVADIADAAWALEELRLKNPTASVTWLLTDYEMTRCDGHVYWSEAPQPAQVAQRFGLTFDWKRLLAVEGAELCEGVALIASSELLASSPALVSALQSSFGASLISRADVAADLTLDECRCVLVRSAQGTTLEEMASSLFRVSAAFSECLLLLRTTTGGVPALLHQLPRAADVVCPSLSLRIILSHGEAGDLDVELAAVGALLARSRERSSLRRVGQGWQRREWLESCESSHEAVLNCFPALSPLTAQLLLSQFPLLQIFRAPQPVAAALGPLLLPRVLENTGSFLRDAASAPSQRPYTNPKRQGEFRKHASKLTLNQPRFGRNKGQTTLSLTKK